MRPDAMDFRKVLLEELATHAYQYRPERPFTLASGATSDEYLDCKLALSHARAMAAVGPVVLDALADGVVAIGGLTMGSDPIAMSTCQASAATGREVRWFSVRKDAKGHGQQKLIEGHVEKGQRVAVVDDVVTSGMSTIKAIRACRASGLDVVQVIVLVDREQSGGLQNIRDEAGAGVPVVAILRKSEIKAEWQKRSDRPASASSGRLPTAGS
jgi:orotate phosphoribosyltransferase